LVNGDNKLIAVALLVMITWGPGERTVLEPASNLLAIKLLLAWHTTVGNPDSYHINARNAPGSPIRQSFILQCAIMAHACMS